MKTTIKFLMYGLMLISMVLLSCSAEDGEDGDTGPQGPPGADGLDGNANVVSGTVELQNSDWLWNSNYSINTSITSISTWFTRYVDLMVPEIDQAIDNEGLVLVYFRFLPQDGWRPLPFQLNPIGSVFDTNIAFETSVGLIRLHYFWTPNTGPIPMGLETHQIATATFKYIIVEGNTLSITSKDPGIDLRKLSYREAMDHLGLDY